MTTIGTTSFFPSKPLGCYGDGGACFTNDPELAVKIRAIKSHGGIERFKHEYIGLNGRLDTLQASILLEKFKYFDITLENRNKCAFYYSEKLKELNDKIANFDKILAEKSKELQKLKVEHKKLIDDTTKELKKDTQEIQSKK